MSKRAAIYARASTGKQDEENQIPAIKQLIEIRGFELVKIYQEKASAWKDGKQKELSKVVKAARAGEFDILVLWALDRLTREGPAKTLTIYKKLEDLGITVISIQEPWTEAPSEFKPVMLAIVGWVAEQESKRISERTKAGIQRRKEGGGKPGRPKGAKDSKPRKTEGYILHQARQRVKRAECGAI